MNGFKNARSVTDFAVGMRICYQGNWQIALYIDKRGFARTRMDPDDGGIYAIAPEHIPHCTLDLDCIWVGREYYSPTAKCRVIMANDEWVVCDIDTGMHLLEARTWFLRRWRPVPLDPPSVAQAPAETWKPEVGKDCQRRDDDAWVNTTVIWVMDSPPLAWVCDHASHRLVDWLSLRPLPPDPPVKVGDWVLVERKTNQWQVGKVFAADSETATILSSDVLLEDKIRYDEEGIKFTHLVPKEGAWTPCGS
jgi:hypothetical protein